MKNPKISIIIPVYNTEDFLRECLDCFLSQTYKNIEVLLVDDGSIDNSGVICNEYSRRDSRFSVIHQKNQGVSAARNTGLDAATGDYIGFVDSDDTFLPELYADYARIIESDNPDMVQSIGMKEKSHKNSANPRLYKFNSAEARGEFFGIGKIRPSVCLSLIKKEVIGNMRFPENILQWEDYAFIAVMVSRCQEVIVTTNRYYQYRYRIGSATKRPLNDKNMSCLLIHDYLRDNNVFKSKQEEHDVVGFFIRCCCLNYLGEPPVDKKRYKGVIRTQISNNKESIGKSRAVSVLEKMVVLSFLWSELVSKCILVLENRSVRLLLSVRDIMKGINK